MSGAAPSSFRIAFERLGPATWVLTTSQLIPLPREEAFAFFEDPANLAAITPEWLHFRLLNKGREPEVFSGAEFDYTITWLGITIDWRSRIIDYHPPERFTDVELRGPYTSWEHLHTFEPAPEGTLMRDRVRFILPLPALPLGWLIRRQLEDIFRYRAERIDEWARGRLKEI